MRVNANASSTRSASSKKRVPPPPNFPPPLPPWHTITYLLCTGAVGLVQIQNQKNHDADKESFHSRTWLLSCACHVPEIILRIECNAPPPTPHNTHTYYTQGLWALFRFKIRRTAMQIKPQLRAISFSHVAVIVVLSCPRKNIGYPPSCYGELLAREVRKVSIARRWMLCVKHAS